jgi:integrase
VLQKQQSNLANSYLPYFLQLDESLIINSNHYIELVKKASIQRAKEYLIENSRTSYPLDLLKIMVSNAITYIDNYASETIEMSRYYVSSHKLDMSEKHFSAYNFIMKKNFLNPEINALKHNIKSAPKKDTLIKVIRVILKDEIEVLEASCMLVILFMTGMRIGEFVALKRFPKITEGEHFNLKRLVYKTASTEDGVEMEMPIPEIAKQAIEVLSIISDIKDNGDNKEIATTTIKQIKVSNAKSIRIRDLIRWYAKKINIKEKVDPHQLRHAMAFLIVHLNEKEGLELARMFLGHTSITMTLQYMGHYNKELNEAIQELTKEESEIFVEKIANEIKENKKIFGKNGERLMPNHKFVGQQAEDFVALMKKGLIKLIEDQKLAIIQTPVSICMHDLSKPEDLMCQRGFSIEKIALNGPIPSRCKGANCSNALFFEEHVEKLKSQMYGNIDPTLKARLNANTFFVEAGGFEQDPFRKIIKDYDEYKDGVNNG